MYPLHLATFMTSLLLGGVLFLSEPASAQQSKGISRSERWERLKSLQQSSQSLESQLSSADSEESIYVSAADGRDTNSCGTRKRPCHTVTQGLKRAREIQTGAKAKTIELVNIEIAPGTYAESVTVKLNWIRLRGAGAGASLIQSRSGPAVLVQSAHPVIFEGLTLAAMDGTSSALHVVDIAFISVSNCEFRDSRRGIGLFTGSSALVTDSTFVNNLRGIAASDGVSAIVEGLTITGISSTQGSGIGIGDGVIGVHDTTISQTQVAIEILKASLYTFGGLLLTNNSFGVSSTESGLVELLGGATITNNSDTGIHLEASSTGIIGSVTINNNGTGISVIGNSYLDLAGTEVKSNTTGLFFDLFGKGVLRQVDVSNNTTNTQTTRGGEFFIES